MGNCLCSEGIMIILWSGTTGVWFQEKARTFVFTAMDRRRVKDQSVSGAVITVTLPVTVISVPLWMFYDCRVAAIQRTTFSFFLSDFLLSFLIHFVSLLSSSLFSLSFPVVLYYVGPLPRNLTTKCRITLSSSAKLIFHRMWKKLVDLIFSFSCVRKNYKGWEGVKDAISVHTSSQNPCGCWFANVWCKEIPLHSLILTNKTWRQIVQFQARMYSVCHFIL
jgi:hypothetical protein